MSDDTQIHADKETIESLGGPAKVAELMGLDKRGGTQRVHNWTVRGIPPAVKLKFPNLFLRGATPEPEQPPKETPM